MLPSNLLFNRPISTKIFIFIAVLNRKIKTGIYLSTKTFSSRKFKRIINNNYYCNKNFADIDFN